MTEVPILSASAITKSFGRGAGTVRALQDVSFSVARGSFTLLKGASGSGKSCLLAALSGLQEPESGVIIANGTNVWGKGRRSAERFRRHNCGYVFQTPGLFPSLTAWQQLFVPLRLLGVPVMEAKGRASHYLDLVGLLDRAQSKPSQLSGGQNQRVAIARMLAKRPAFIFCDEPTSALDGRNAIMVSKLLRDATEHQGATILCATHDDRLVPFANRVIELEEGRLVSDTAEPMP
ncbi:ABC transporter ATP-binding protein [Aquidulcibacter paucihalophilus]|uniref:ABC transporter ATP-binding protein n=1 Tax=Aquidulcibacter paucihalophilus TaxID=1978549 RepID=UPI000A191B8B|nr:ABC transporter ATP-binding protein [Aquidulcibacter paucihalophilus]